MVKGLLLVEDVVPKVDMGTPTIISEVTARIAAPDQ